MVDELTEYRGRCNVLIFEDNKGMTDFMVDKWKSLSNDAFGGQGIFTAALSGGNTPRDFYVALAGLTDEGMWRKAHVFMADERYVPPTDSDSNYGMLSRLLLDKVPIPAGNRHPVPVQEKTLEKTAENYEAAIRTFFRLGKQEFPQFDLIMLGLGEDGHTASLFPSQDALKEREHLVYPVRKAPKAHARVTLTLPVINHARNVVFLVTGREKAAAAKGVLEERDPALPAFMIRPETGNLSFLLDRAAASLLSAEFQHNCGTVT